jgi:hypothetical protein
VARYEGHIAPADLAQYWGIARFAEGGIDVYLTHIRESRDIVEA